MNSPQSLEQTWRYDVFSNFRFWDNIADSFNPLMAVLLLGVALWLSRDSHSRAGRFLWRSLLALLLSFAVAKLLKRFHLFEPNNFPSTHMTIAVSLATSIISVNLRWLILLPLLAAYAWLMTALRFHSWLDIAGGALIAAAITAIIQIALSRRERAARRAQTSTRTVDLRSNAKSSERSKGVRSDSAAPSGTQRNGSKRAGNTTNRATAKSSSKRR